MNVQASFGYSHSQSNKKITEEKKAFIEQHTQDKLEKENKINIEMLPNEMLYLIDNYLPIKDRISLRSNSIELNAKLPIITEEKKLEIFFNTLYKLDRGVKAHSESSFKGFIAKLSGKNNIEREDIQSLFSKLTTHGHRLKLNLTGYTLKLIAIMYFHDAYQADLALFSIKNASYMGPRDETRLITLDKDEFFYWLDKNNIKFENCNVKEGRRSVQVLLNNSLFLNLCKQIEINNPTEINERFTSKRKPCVLF